VEPLGEVQALHVGQELDQQLERALAGSADVPWTTIAATARWSGVFWIWKPHG
jgi:hypothetical protein